MRRIAAFVCACALSVGLSGPAAAMHHGEDKLDDLFAELRQVETPEEARPIEDAIWELWLESGDIEIDSLMLFGISAIEIGDLPAALATFDELIKAAPEYSEAWNKRATVHYLMGNLEASVADIAQTLILEPRHFGALSGLGLIYVSIGKDKAALKAFEQAQAIAPHLEGLDTLIAKVRLRLEGRGI